MSNDNHTYEAALEALLRSPLHQAKTKEELAKAAARRTQTIGDMKTYLRRIKLDTSQHFPKVIHVTGTKGKGSTCCLCESILRHHYGYHTGLFTSPHLVDIRERIRINGKPISKQVFAQVYWQVRTRLEADASLEENSDPPVLPGYFRMLTLMALFAFAHYSPPLDVILLEVGMGGRYDATNVLDMDGTRRQVVCGVTLLDLDHTRVLGNTLEQIAWEKGGIFQSVKGQSTSEDTTLQNNNSFFAIDTNTPSVLDVLGKCAKEEGNGRTLHQVGNCSQAVPKDAGIGLPGKHQRINAELAVSLCRAITKDATTKVDNPETLRKALAQATWPGRCQTVSLPQANKIQLRLDGSHTPISLRAGYEWFCQVSSNQQQQPQKILVFNCSHERNPVELLQILLDGAVFFDKAYFCRSDFERPSAVTKKDAQSLLSDAGIQPQSELLPASGGETVVTWQRTLESIWKHLEQSTAAETTVNLTAGEAMEQISKQAGRQQVVEVFVVGSLYIVGSALNAIGWSEEEAEGTLQLPEN